MHTFVNCQHRKCFNTLVIRIDRRKPSIGVIMAIMVYEELSPCLAIKRIKNELNEIIESPPPGCSEAPIDFNDLFFWRATIEGPKDSAYQGGKYQLDIELSEGYPFMPPKVTFKTKIDHPYINSSGVLSLDALRMKNWSHNICVCGLLLSIIYFLAD